MSWTDNVLRIGLTGAHHILKASWFLRRPRTFGAHALALTADRKIILVKLRYSPGWRVPGGGRRPNEPALQAALRELKEEIGMQSYTRVRLACELEERTDFKRDLASLLIVEGVQYRPKSWSWEIEQVGEFGLDDLPADTAPLTRRWIGRLRRHV